MSERYDAYCITCGIKTDVGRNCIKLYEYFGDYYRGEVTPYSCKMVLHEKHDSGVNTVAYDWGIPGFTENLKRVGWDDFFKFVARR